MHNAMTIHHGNVIYYKDNEWVYEDGEPVGEQSLGIYRPRDCPYCGLKAFYCEECNDYHDGCLRHIPNAINACCGHGIKDVGYIQMKDEKDIEEVI